MGSDFRGQLSASFFILVNSINFGGCLLCIQKPEDALNQYVIEYH